MSLIFPPSGRQKSLFQNVLVKFLFCRISLIDEHAINCCFKLVENVHVLGLSGP